MQHQVSELEGENLSYAVAQIEARLRMIAGTKAEQLGGYYPHLHWQHGGPIIERERITIGAPGFMKSGLWEAFIDPMLDVRKDDIVGRFEGYGPTPLIAAMRAYVASKCGETIELP